MATGTPLAVNRARLDELFRRNPYVKGLGAELVEWDGGVAVLRLAPDGRHGNFLGAVHGGALFSLADSALEVASNSWGRVAVALTVEAQFLSAPAVGEELVATAVERSRTRRTAAYAIDVVSVVGGTLRAGFSAMAFRTASWHLGEDAWPEDWRSSH